MQEVAARLTLYNFCKAIVNNTVIEQKETKYIYEIDFTTAVKICRQFLRGMVKATKVGDLVKSFSPYAVLWNSDYYYVVGYSDSHGKIVTFRVDRIAAPELSDEPAVPVPEGFDPSIYSRGVFQMFDGKEQDVTIKCENTLMKPVYRA